MPNNTTLTSPNNVLSGGNCTIDFWVKYTNYVGSRYAPCNMYISSGVIMANAFSRIYIGSNTVSYSDWWETNSWVTGSNFNHYAYVRTGSTVLVFLNGVLKSSRSSSKAWSGKITLGGTSSSGGTYYRYFSDFRVTDKIARWTTNFKVPSEKYVYIPPNTTN